MKTLSHLQRLEAESVQILRQVVAEADKPVVLYSIETDRSPASTLCRPTSAIASRRRSRRNFARAEDAMRSTFPRRGETEREREAEPKYDLERFGLRQAQIRRDGAFIYDTFLPPLEFSKQAAGQG